VFHPQTNHARLVDGTTVIILSGIRSSTRSFRLNARGCALSADHPLGGRAASMVLIIRSTGTRDGYYDLKKKNAARVIRMIGSEPMRKPIFGMRLSRRLPYADRQTTPCDRCSAIAA
jgi:hypothetical protein